MSRLSLKFLTARRAVIAMALLGLVFIGGIGGAAILYFDLGPAEWLRSAFLGFDAWLGRGLIQPVPDEFQTDVLAAERPVESAVDKPGKTFDGFTVFTSSVSSRASLLDMRGNIVHEWDLPFSKAWPKAPHVEDPLDDKLIHWFRCRLFPNGDLLAIYQTDGDTPHGYGLVKLDKDSKLLWKYAGRTHHDLDIGEDGRIYTLTHEIAKKKYPGIEFAVPPFIDDYLVVLSPNGEEQQKISLLEAYQNSQYGLTFSLFKEEVTGGMHRANELPPPPPPEIQARIRTTMANRRTTQPTREKGELFHPNGVRVLSRDLSARFPLFKEGQVLISLRGINTIAVLDIPSKTIAWSVQGIWKGQHDAEFLENGHLLLYDNAGAKNSRVLEFDPKMLTYPWSYSGENTTPFFASARGMKQRLPNGNTLVVDPDNARLLEVTFDKELVWEYGFKRELAALQGKEKKNGLRITGAFRYRPEQLTFLKQGTRVRPQPLIE